MQTKFPLERCYHCDNPIPQGSAFFVQIGESQQQVCSSNCQHTAEWIAKHGLSDYYRLRQGPSQRPTAPQNTQHWDSDNLKRHVVRTNKAGLSEVSLLVDGVHCSGCVWLIERLLLQLEGVEKIQLNPVTRRALLQFDAETVPLSTLLSTIAKAGYDPRPLDSDALDDSRQQESRDLLKRLLVAGFAMMQVSTYAFVLYMENFEPLPHATRELFRWLGFLVATPVVFYSAIPFYRGAKQALQHKSLNMDVPIAIAITAVYVSSVYQAMVSQGEVYFDSVTMLVFFLLIGRYLEMRARHHSVDNADALIRLRPSFAQRRKPDGTLEKVAVMELNIGDVVQVPEGAHVPADGTLLSEHTLLDESLLSGESTARRRQRHETLIAGSLVLEGPIDMQVSQVGQDTFLSQLAHLSTQAQTQRPKWARQSENITARFVRRVLIFTTVTLAAWLWYDPSQALTATIALLVVACPCALGLAAPAAITRSLGVLARKNVLVVNPDVLEALPRLSRVVFDKTGTLTEPTLVVEGVDKAILQLAASLARESEHPLSKALVQANTLPLLAVTQATSFPGLGLEGTVAGRKLRLGQAAFVLDEPPQELDQASLVVGEEGRLLAVFETEEKLRPDALITIKALQARGVECEILSGDTHARVERIAQALNIRHWRARQMPEDKLTHLQTLQNEGHCLMAVGDGSNDAPVLGGADISVALTSGTELAQANADALLCTGQLSGVLDLLTTSEQTQVILRQNQRWAFTYNTVAMPVAALGYIPPWLAAIFMSASSLLVVLNALRIGKQPKLKARRQP